MLGPDEAHLPGAQLVEHPVVLVEGGALGHLGPFASFVISARFTTSLYRAAERDARTAGRDLGGGYGRFVPLGTSAASDEGHKEKGGRAAEDGAGHHTRCGDLTEAHQRARSIISERRDTLEQIARRLPEKRLVFGI